MKPEEVRRLEEIDKEIDFLIEKVLLKEEKDKNDDFDTFKMILYFTKILPYEKRLVDVLSAFMNLWSAISVSGTIDPDFPNEIVRNAILGFNEILISSLKVKK